MGSIPQVSLGSYGATIPVLGFGTAAYPFVASEKVKESILEAIKLGYRHFDTAAIYLSEQSLGEAVAEALHLKLIKSRHELFITSKLWCADAHPGLVLPALKTTLRKLGLEYVDLYLIHNPVSLKPGEHVVSFDKNDLVPMDFKSVWEAMEDCHQLGLTKHLGVSNFSCKKLETLLATSKVPPVVNQRRRTFYGLFGKVEMSPLWQQKKLREFCKEKGVHITAYSPLGARGTPWASNHVLDCDVLKKIAEAKGKTVPQVCLRWVHEQGVSVLVKSFNKERMKENLEIFDWALSPEECQEIDQIPQRIGCPGREYIYEEGPYKSLEDLWDEKIDYPSETT